MESLPPAAVVFLLVSVVAVSSFSVSGEEIDATGTESYPSLPNPIHLLPPSHPPAYAPSPHHSRHHHHRPMPGGSPSPHVEPNPPHKPPHAVAPSPHHGHHHHSKPPHPAPTVPPTYPPPPTYHVPPPPPPHVHPGPHPILPPRSFIAAQGVVYCKPCKYAGVGTLLDAVPLHGAEVELRCNSSKYRPVAAKAVSDKNGYYYIDAPKTVTSFAAHRCLVFFVAVPPKCACTNITDFHGGLQGAPLLRLEKPPIGAMPPKRLLFSIAPFAAEPGTCHH